MNLNDWFDRGIEKEEYMAALDKHRDSFMHIYKHFKVPEEDKALLGNKSDLRVIVLADVWCGHCMLDIPILLNIAEQANIPVRFLLRDSNLELMDKYLTDGKRYIPIMIFIDKDGNELTKWGPMAPEIKEFAAKLKEDLPVKDSPGYKEAFQKFAATVGKTFRSNEKFWNYVYEDIKKVLA